MSDIVTKYDIKPSYRSDHSILEMDFLLNNFTFGKGIWKFNNSLLQLPQYISRINDVIDEELNRYSLPVYSLDFIKNSTKDLTLSIDYDLFLELLFLRIRGETIKFASHEKQKNNKVEQQLISDIETLEMGGMIPNSQLFIDKKAELETFRQQKVKGEMVQELIG